MSYKITTTTAYERVLVFTVDSYERVGDSIEFIDSRTNMFKSFPARVTQIEEVEA